MTAISAPREMTLRAWWHALRDAGKAFAQNNLSDSAAALTYYSTLSIFPGLLVLVALLGVLGNEDTVDGLLRIVDDLGPDSAVDTVRGPLEKIVDSSGTAGAALAIGVVVALYSASGYIGAFIRATNEIWEVDEERPFLKRRPLQLLITVAVVLALAAILLVVVVGGPLASAIGAEIGLGETALDVWSLARWPLMFGLVVVVIAFLYRVSPDVRHHGLRWILAGSLMATLLWLLASAGFNLYVSNFGSYPNTYGSLAGVIVFLIWLWLTNVAILFGAQFAAELERTAAAARSGSASGDPVPLRPADK
jgi:membrane protein